MKNIGDFIENLYIDMKQNKPSVYTLWEDIAGAEIAEHSEVLNIDKGKLIIYVDHPGWKQIIMAKKKLILYKLIKLAPDPPVYGLIITNKKPKR